MILSPLLFIKVLIARYYKKQHGLLMPIGLTIFVLSFVLIASTTGPYLTRTSKVERRMPVTVVSILTSSPKRVGARNRQCVLTRGWPVKS